MAHLKFAIGELLWWKRVCSPAKIPKIIQGPESIQHDMNRTHCGFDLRMLPKSIPTSNIPNKQWPRTARISILENTRPREGHKENARPREGHTKKLSRKLGDRFRCSRPLRHRDSSFKQSGQAESEIYQE